MSDQKKEPPPPEPPPGPSPRLVKQEVPTERFPDTGDPGVVGSTGDSETRGSDPVGR